MILIKNLEKLFKEKYNAEFLYIDTNSTLDTKLDGWAFYTTTYIVYYKDSLKEIMFLRDVRDEEDLIEKIDEVFRRDNE